MFVPIQVLGVRECLLRQEHSWSWCVKLAVVAMLAAVLAAYLGIKSAKLACPGEVQWKVIRRNKVSLELPVGA